jgi:hypothetical protein
MTVWGRHDKLPGGAGSVRQRVVAWRWMRRWGATGAGGGRRRGDEWRSAREEDEETAARGGRKDRVAAAS